MNKKTSLVVIIILAALIVVVAVGGVLLFDWFVGKDEPETPTGGYTLQTTTRPTIPVDTSSWIDLNSIAASATASDTSNVSESGAVITTAGQQQGYLFDEFGNLVDNKGNIVFPYGQWGNQSGGIQSGNQTQDTTKPVENTEALKDPVNDENEFGEFSIDKDGIITEYLGDKENIIIPQKDGGKIITGIGEKCFANTNIKSVQIPETVSYIGNFAFENCTRLTTVVFISSSTKVVIGTSAFQNCVSLKSISLPVVSDLGGTAFNNCTALTEVRFTEGSKKIGNYAFSNCPNLTMVVVPQSVDTIGTGAFEGFYKDKLTIVTPADSKAWDYAINNGIKHTTHE